MKPVDAYVSWTSPLSCLPSVSISHVPKPRFSGGRTVGPFFSVQVRCKRSVYWSSVQVMSTHPAATEGDPNFVVFVQSSLSVIATAIAAPEVIRISGPVVRAHAEHHLVLDDENDGCNA